jgi:hypothetical protein
VAAADIEAEFSRFSFQALIEMMEIKPQYSNDTICVINISKSMQNIMRVVRNQTRDSSKPPLFGKTGFRSVLLSKSLAPGQLVKDVKVALMRALQLQDSDHSALEAPLDDLSASVDLSCGSTGGPNSFRRSMCEGSTGTCTARVLAGMRSPEGDSAGKIAMCFPESKAMRSNGSAGAGPEFDGDDGDSDSDSGDSDSGNNQETPTIPSTTAAGGVIRLTDASHRLSRRVEAPSLPRGTVVVAGRVTQWQLDEEKHQKGKEHFRRMTATALALEVERLSFIPPKRKEGKPSGTSEHASPVRPSVHAPSSPREIKASHTTPRSRATATLIVPRPKGMPPPELDADLSALSVRSFMDTLGNSLGQLSHSTAVSPEKSPKKVMKATTATKSASSDRQDASVVTKWDVSKRVHQTAVKLGGVNIPHVGRVTLEEASDTEGEETAMNDTLPTATVTATGSRPGSALPASHRLVTSPGTTPTPIAPDRSLDPPSESLIKPQTFALQMINELAELKGRGDNVTAEESQRLVYINNAINAIIAQESSMVNDISDRLDSLHTQEESVVEVGEGEGCLQEQLPRVHRHHRDPLTPFCYTLQRPRDVEQRRDEGGLGHGEGKGHGEGIIAPPLSAATVSAAGAGAGAGGAGAVSAGESVSYKRYAAYHHNKNLNVLSELASFKFS